jgi:hypothetical protein
MRLGDGLPKTGNPSYGLGRDVLICRITSAASSTPLDITIADWSSAGLAKPSIARLDRLVTAEKSLLHVRLGITGLSN